MEIPVHLRYSKDHEWVEVEGNRARIGITDYAQQSLGDIVFVELPQVGDELTAQDSFGVVESVKSASDVYTPVSGKVVAVNEALLDSPQLINSDPLRQGVADRDRDERPLRSRQPARCRELPEAH